MTGRVAVANGYPRRVVAVTGIVRGTDGRVLLVRGDHREWESPRGQVEHGEDLVTALKREISEDSNCEIEVGELAGVCSNLGRQEEDVPEQVHLTFECRWVSGEPCTGEKCADAGWFSGQEVLHLVTAPQQRSKLFDVLVENTGVPYRAFGTRPYELLLKRDPG